MATRYKENPNGLPRDQFKNWWNSIGVYEIPDEELTCAECDGNGVIRREVPLEEALEKIAAQKGGNNESQ